MADGLQALLQIPEARRNIHQTSPRKELSKAWTVASAIVEGGFSTDVKSLGSFGEGLIEVLRRHLPLLEQFGPRLFLLVGVGLFFIADFSGLGVVQPTMSRLVEGGHLERKNKA